MPVLVTIPISTWEITVEYETPNIRLWADRTHIIEALFKALRPWGLKLDDIDILDQGKNSDKGCMFRLPLKKATFFFGAAYCRFAKDDANWSMAEETLAILDSGLSTLLQAGGVKIGSQRTGLGLHLQPKTGSFIDILSPFIPPQLRNLEVGPLYAMASIVSWENRRIYIDGSGSLANAVFVRIDRSFGPDTTYEEMAEQIRSDESIILRTLNMEEDLS